MLKEFKLTDIVQLGYQWAADHINTCYGTITRLQAESNIELERYRTDKKELQDKNDLLESRIRDLESQIRDFEVELNFINQGRI